MKRLITLICLIAIIIIGYFLISKGLESKAFSVASYRTIESESAELTQKLANYDKKNQDEYEATVVNLKSSIKSYQDSKTKYERIVEELADVLKTEDSPTEVAEEIIYSDKEKYKVDFLLVTLGGYGEKEGVDVFYQLLASSTTDPNSTTLNYFLADLKFTVTGVYMDVTNFISDLENDDRLGWEIKEFSMANGTANGYNGVSATFTIKNVPIDSESYLESASYSNGNMSGTMTDEKNGNDAPTIEQKNTENTVTNMSSTENTMTTNTVSNNTVN